MLDNSTVNKQLPHTGVVKWLSPLLLVALCLALVTVVISSYIRVAESGAGCEPWPSCYGQYSNNENAQGINVLMAKGEQSSYRAERVIHRLVTSTLGGVILFLFILSWRTKFRIIIGRAVPTALLLLALILALIGPIHPVSPIPILNLSNFVGGMLLAALIFYLYQKVSHIGKLPIKTPFPRLISWGIVLIALQILWGGWTSANYAGSACDKLLDCNVLVQHSSSLLDIFNPVNALLLNQQSQVVIESKMEIIQLIHHYLALVTLVYFLIIISLIMRTKKRLEQGLRKECMLTTSLLVLQFLTGMSTIFFELPISLVLLHNLLAALLLLVITSIYLKLSLRTSV